MSYVHYILPSGAAQVTAQNVGCIPLGAYTCHLPTTQKALEAALTEALLELAAYKRDELEADGTLK